MAKPIKRSEHIVQLSKEHHFSLLFCWKIRAGLKKAVDVNRIVNYIRYFSKDHLLPHFEEEDILFVAVDDEFVKRAYREHAEINDAVRDLLVSNDDEEKAKLASKIADLVDNHVRFEERELFPHLEKAISEPELVEIGKKLKHAQPEITQDVFPDEFWK